MAWSPDLIDSRLQAVIYDKGFSSNYLKQSSIFKIILVKAEPWNNGQKIHFFV